MSAVRGLKAERRPHEGKRHTSGGAWIKQLIRLIGNGSDVKTVLTNDARHHGLGRATFHAHSKSFLPLS